MIDRQFAQSKETNQQRSGEEKAAWSLAVSLLAFGCPALLGCVKWRTKTNY
jgi:hypothetical protein